MEQFDAVAISPVLQSTIILSIFIFPNCDEYILPVRILFVLSYKSPLEAPVAYT